MKENKDYILWLASWYPNKLTPFNGDFTQRHAKAVSAIINVHVIHVIRDTLGDFTKNILIEEAKEDQLLETIIYYYIKPNKFDLLDKFNSNKKYRQCFKMAINDCIKKNAKPKLVHIHVTWKAGSLGVWIKKKFGIPYVITEHWSAFLPAAKNNLKSMPFYIRKACYRILNNTKAISVVSYFLATQLKKITRLKEISIIPNVVDTSIFYPVKSFSANVIPQFIHISTLEPLKNPSIILQAFASLHQQNIPFQLHIYGPEDEPLKQLVHELGVENNVTFHGLVPQLHLAGQMQQSDGLILYSQYETFGCVVIEAHACGVPTIVSDLPVFHEIVKDCKNGIFVKKNDATALAEKIKWFINNRQQFDRNKIAQDAHKKFSYNIVGRQFFNWYTAILNKP